MATKVLVPRLGEGVDELTIVKWLKAEGSSVKELESLLEVETDKVVTEIPSPASGILLKIMVPENTSAQVGEVMAWIGQAGENIPVSGIALSEKQISNVKTQTGVEKPSTVVSAPASIRNLGFYIPCCAENCIREQPGPVTGSGNRVEWADHETRLACIHGKNRWTQG